MIVYADTSALVKLYVQESHSDQVAETYDAASVVATVLIAFVETHAAFSRALRTDALAEDDATQARISFEHNWSDFLIVDVDNALVEAGARLTRQFPLRAFDAVHLAAAVRIQSRLDEPFLFACFDRQLNAAATSVGLNTLKLS